MKIALNVIFSAAFLLYIGGLPTPLKAAEPTSSTILSEPFALNATNIRKIQIGLQRLGYNSGPIDGLFGPLTSRAIINFQNDNGISQSGYPDDSFRARFNKKSQMNTSVTD